jgi:hypothetical protein
MCATRHTGYALPKPSPGQSKNPALHRKRQEQKEVVECRIRNKSQPGKQRNAQDLGTEVSFSS